MKKLLQSFTLLLVACCLLGGLPAALASHIQGGQMTYRYVSGDTYEVTVSFYRDCSGIDLPTGAITIFARQSCNATTSVTGSLTPVPGSRVTGTPYCPAIQALATCSNSQTTYPNYEKQDYRGTIVLPPAATWIISYDDSARPNTANLTSNSASFRFEATLNNLVTVNGVPTRANNTSPLFSARDIPVPFVLVNQRTSINFTSAAEPDGDSLVYSLDRPLASCGVYNDYAARVSNSNACVSGPLPAAPGTICFLNCASSLSPSFTANFPIPVAIDTAGTCGVVSGQVYYRTVTPRFQLNVTNGQITLTPNLFRPGATALGLNKYVVVGKITEYRRLPGSNRRYLVGSVRRDFLVIVTDGSGNMVPMPPVVTIPDPKTNGTTINTADTTRITIKTCSYTQVRVNFTDPDNITTPTHPAVTPLQLLTVTYTGTGTINFNQLQNGDIGTFQLIGDGTPTPQGRFFFQPGSTYAGQTIRIPLRIEDNACPVKGTQTRIIEIKIERGDFAVASGIVGASGIGNTVPGTGAICAGGSLQLRGKVVRPDSIRRLATNTTQVQVYAFQWSVLTGSGGGLPAVTTDSLITVNPTSTTRYRLTISPTLGFAQGSCGDTSSVLVRVVPEPVATATASLPQVCAGAAVLLTGSAARPPGVGSTLNDTYAYRWTGPGIATAGVAGPTLTVRPTALGVNTYTLQANGLAPYACVATTTVSVTVVPPPTLTTVVSLAQVCAGGTVVLRIRAKRPAGAGSALADAYTFAWTGPGIVGSATDSILTVRPTALGVNTYSVAVTGLAQFNCSNTTTAQVTVVPPPTVTATTALPKVCAGTPVQLTVSAVRPTGAGSTLPDTYTYTWSGPGVLPNTTTTNTTLTVSPVTLGVNTYTVTATGTAQFNCSNTTTVQVTVVPPPVVVATTVNTFVCPGGTANLVALATPPTGFTDTYTYTWTGGGLPAGTTGAAIAVKPTATTTYTVTATGGAQTGCAATAMVTVQVPPPAITADFATADSLGTNGQRTTRPPVTFTFTNKTSTTGVSNLPTASFGYKWTYQRVRDVKNGAVSEPETIFSTQATPAPLTLPVAGYYIIRLTATANVGGAPCATVPIAARTILVPDAQVPNIITPNGDNLNDVFKISTAGTASKVEIYNRWGRKVYEQASYQNNWGGDNQPAGVYYYLVTDRNGAQTKGWLEIVR